MKELLGMDRLDHHGSAKADKPADAEIYRSEAPPAPGVPPMPREPGASRPKYYLSFNGRSILDGIIFSEILKGPRGRR